MHVFEFDSAIVREPSASVVQGLRSDAAAVPDLDGIRSEHTAYVAALRDAGLAVDTLPPLEAFPDSVFVEDPALVFPGGAILLRPGAPSRLGEADEMRGALERRFAVVHMLEGGQYADGGDVLVTPRAVYVGLSQRTGPKGAEALAAKLDMLGRKPAVVQTPPSVLHLKSAASLLDDETLLATRAIAASGIFKGFRIITIPEGEEPAANALRVNAVILLGEDYPRTQDVVVKAGFTVRPLPVREIAKLDAGLSCMSLRWKSLGPRTPPSAHS